MAEVIMILGESGSGKSASLRNFKPGEVCVLNVAGKRLPFRNQFGQSVVNLMNTSIAARYGNINCIIHSGKYPCYVIDDSQYLMAFEAFDRALEIGYGKFTEMAKHFYDLITGCKQADTIWEKDPKTKTWRDTGKPLPETNIYFLHHVEKDDSGFIKPKTQGKMIDEKLNLAGMFSIVLLAGTDGNDYWFQTRSDGMSVVKSPMGMFPEERIPNDLAMVDRIIRDYYREEAGGNENGN